MDHSLQALGIALHQLGTISGIYMLAAFIAGVAGATILDRFDRRRALVIALIGLSLGSILGALAVGFVSLLAARFFAGFFAGPVSSLCYAIALGACTSMRVHCRLRRR